MNRLENMSAAMKTKHGNRFKDEIGNKYGFLTVVSFSHYDSKKHAHFWNCKCDCGNMTVKNGNSLRRKEATSCGCKKIKRFIGNKLRETHSGSYTRLYQTWHGMKSRCYRKTDVAYERYGGRGIKVCEEWQNDFETFRDWALQNGYSDTLSIDRIDNDGNYEPSNCQFITLAENTKKANKGKSYKSRQNRSKP